MVPQPKSIRWCLGVATLLVDDKLIVDFTMKDVDRTSASKAKKKKLVRHIDMLY